ncbi:MAG: hypothetical protein CFH19_01029 [Alphaproteobacteria bacterium MarineAlpha5_Bin9]|nr:MAG: hypothetical protein CFH19_01029 [Alphaproteobacteria bacterium MarineAlpha5_Bin9]|tara:strand:+ start:3487 stop:3672 length:186 start_codon:yes stop_codon:yes gene_type:complete
MINKIFILFSLLFIIPTNVFARCAVCYTNGLSGASIAVIVIVTSFILLFFANKLLKKILKI